MTEKKYNVAVVGATGMVGRTMLSILEERNFPVDKVYALASSRSVGTRIPFKDSELVIGDLETFDLTAWMNESVTLIPSGPNLLWMYI